jgi:predicted Zn-dependent peptidase
MWQPVRYPLRGTHALFLELDRSDLLKYYNNFYVIDNVLVVIAGDLDARETVRLFSNALVDMPRKTASLPPRYGSPEQTSPRWLEQHGDVTQSYVCVGIATVDEGTRDSAELDVIARLLNIRSREITAALGQRAGMIRDIDVSVIKPPRSRQALAVTFTSTPGAAPGAARTLSEWLLGNPERLWTKKDVEGMTQVMTTEYLSDRQQPGSVAQTVGEAVLRLGNPHFPTTRASRWSEVTARTVQDVYRKYFTPERVTTVILSPTPRSQADETAVNTTILASERSLIGTAEYPVQRLLLDNGVTLVFRRNPQEPVVHFLFCSSGGLWCETPLNNGVFSLLGALMCRNFYRPGENRFVAACRSAGMVPRARCEEQFYSLAAATRPGNAVEGARLLCAAWSEPPLMYDMLYNARTSLLERLIAQPTNTADMADFVFRASLFERQPYRMNRYGSVVSVPGLDLRDASGVHSDFITPRSTVVVVSGNFDEQVIRNTIADAFRRYIEKPKTQDFLRQSRLFSVNTFVPFLTVNLPPDHTPTGAYTRLYTSVNPRTLVVCGIRAPGCTDTNYPPYIAWVVKGGLLEKIDSLCDEWQDIHTVPVVREADAVTYQGYETGWVYAYITVPEAFSVEARRKLQAIFRDTLQELSSGTLLPAARRRARYAKHMMDVSTEYIMKHLAVRELFGYTGTIPFSFQVYIDQCTGEDLARLADEYGRYPVTAVVTPQK